MKRLWRYRFARVDLQLGFCIALLGGIGLAHCGWQLPSLFMAIAVSCGVLVIRRYNVFLLVAAIGIGLSLGLSRGQLFQQKLGAYKQIEDQKVEIVVTALNDGVYGTNSQLAFDADRARVLGQPLAGKLHISGFGLNSVLQGDEVIITGKLRLGSGQYQAYVSYAQLRLIRHHPSLVADVRRRFAAGMQSALPEPQASFAMGLLIGQRSNLPANIKQDMLMVGLTHIIAVSGYNLTIMLHAARRLLGNFSRHLSLGLSLGLIVAFLLLTGSSASIVRAAIISMLSIWASYFGRNFRPLNLILITAALTAWMSPFYVWSDMSWYLSFLAFYGVLVLAPMIAARFHHAWQRSVVATIALESVCAELMTLPIIIFVFGQLSLVGLLANLLVVALIPLAMLLSFLAGLAGMLMLPVAGWFAWPAQLALTYMLDTAHLLARMPGIFIEHLSLSVAQMLALYGVILALSFVWWHKTKKLEAGKITDEESKLSGVSFERTQQMVND